MKANIQNLIAKFHHSIVLVSPWIFLIGMLRFNFQQFFPYKEVLKGPQFFDFFTDIDIFMVFFISISIFAIATKSIKFTIKRLPSEIIFAIGFLFLAGIIQLEFQNTVEPVLVSPDKYFRGFIVFPLIYFLIIITTQNYRDIKKLIISYFLMVSALCALSLTQYFFGKFPGDTTDFTGRLSWPYVDFLTLKQASANWLAFFTTPALIMSFIKSFEFLRKKNHSNLAMIAYITFILTAVVIYLVQSFGAYISILLVISFYFFQKLSFKKFLIALSIVTIAGTSVYFIQKQSPKVKILEGTQNYKYENSVDSRKSIYTMALHIIKTRPIKGVGLNQFQSYFAKNYKDVLKKEFNESHIPPHAHNFFLSFWTNLGFFGFLAMIILILALLLRSKLNPTNPAIFAVIAMMLHGLIDSYYWRQEIAYLFWLIIAFTYIGSFVHVEAKKEK